MNAGLNGFPQDGVEGIPSEWMFLTSLSVEYGSLWAGDPAVCDRQDGCVIEVPNGDYVVEVQGYDFDGIRIIGRARARLISGSDLSPGDLVGEVGTDSAMIAICDMGSIDAAVAGADEVFQKMIDEYDFQRFGLIQFQMNSEINIAYFSSGFGDGTSSMCRLMAGGECVGIELDFVCESQD